MSTSVLKRALELFKEGGDISEKCNKGDTKKAKRSRKQKHIIEAKKRNTSSWQTAADIRRRLQSKDRTDDNLRTLKLLASTSIEEDIADKILMHTGHKKEEKAVTVTEDKTVFTEEDFEKFEKEYFLSG